jgi:hypothetical protein
MFVVVELHPSPGVGNLKSEDRKDRNQIFVTLMMMMLARFIRVLGFRRQGEEDKEQELVWKYRHMAPGYQTNTGSKEGHYYWV